MTSLRSLVVLLALFIAATASAATTADRSPFVQGHWWSPAKPGSGFDFFSSGREAMAIWYTYDRTGKPVWYTAQGEVSSLGSAWTLLRHRWDDGRKGEAVAVGTLHMNVLHPESVEVTWTLDGATGTTIIEPFVNSGITNEVDHTGSWYRPGNDGWGLAVTQQGDVLGGVLFGYDTEGAPMWVSGFGRERDSVELHYFSGSCPACAYAQPVGRSVGRLGLEFGNELQLTVRNRLALAMAPGVAGDGAQLTQLSRPASQRQVDRQLASFAGPASLQEYLRAGMLNLRPVYGGSDFSAGGSTAAPFSLTNLIESGVDEADLVKTDGNAIYTYEHQGTIRLPRVRVALVGDGGETIESRGSFPLAAGSATPMDSAGLFLHGTKLISINATQPSSSAVSPWISGGAWPGGRTNIEIFDVTRRAAPVNLWRAEIEGHLFASRRIGDRVYLVIRYVPNIPGFFFGYDSPANRELAQGASLEALLPKVRVNGGDPRVLLAPSQVFAPPMGGRPPMADLIMVVAIDLANPGTSQAFAVAGSAESVYVSTQNLYLATSRYELRNAFGAMTTLPSTLVTDIHQVRLGADAMRIVGSGTVEGFLAQDPGAALFRMSEHEGRLRVVTASSTWWGADSRNRLTILEPSTVAAGVLKTVSYLPNPARPQLLGKPGEFLHATRFAGERLYAVTFKKIDPLYVVDMANAADPRIAGQLELPGFSDYLHPLPNGLLLGFGKDTAPPVNGGSGDGQFAWYQGLALTLFDVSNTSVPREIQRVIVGKRGSDSALLRDHHAFSALRKSDGSLAIGIPMRVHEGAAYYTYPGEPGATYYNWAYSGLARFDLVGDTPANASLQPRTFVVSHRASPGSSTYWSYDPATSTGRSVLFENNSLYVGDGLFWDHDRAGNLYGPY